MSWSRHRGLPHTGKLEYPTTGEQETPPYTVACPEHQLLRESYPGKRS